MGEDGGEGPGSGPGEDELGDVGPVSNTGAGTGLWPGPEYVPGGLWWAPKAFDPLVAVNRVFDMCDPAQAFAATHGRFLAPGEAMTQEQADQVGWNTWGAECDIPGGKRYAFAGTRSATSAAGPFAGDPSWRSAFKASVEEVLADERVASRLAHLRAWPGTPLLGTALVARGDAHQIFPREDADRVVVMESSVSVVDGVVRGYAWNQSRSLYARDVTVTVRPAPGSGGGGAAVSYEWPLTVQPGEQAPFEIEGWTGSADHTALVFEVQASLSTKPDLSRSFDVSEDLWVLGNYAGPVTEEQWRKSVPDHVIEAQGGAVADEAHNGRIYFAARLKVPTSEPGLEQQILNQKIPDLRAYLTFRGVLDGRENVVIDLIELVPYRLLGIDWLPTPRKAPLDEVPYDAVHDREIPIDFAYVWDPPDDPFNIVLADQVWIGGASPPSDRTQEPATPTPAPIP